MDILALAEGPAQHLAPLAAEGGEEAGLTAPPVTISTAKTTVLISDDGNRTGG